MAFLPRAAPIGFSLSLHDSAGSSRRRYYASDLIISFIMIHARSYIISQINKYDRQFSNSTAYIFLHCIDTYKEILFDDCKLMTRIVQNIP